MSQIAFGHVTEEGFLSLLNAVKQGAWDTIQLPTQPTPAELLEFGLPKLCKYHLLHTILSMRRIFHPKPEDAPALFDTDWDRIQRLLATDVVVLENSADPQTRADAAILRNAMLKGRGTAQTTLRYEAEVQWGFAQVEKSDESAIASLLQRHHLQPRLDQVEATTRALAQAIGWDLSSHSRLRPYMQQRHALKECARVCKLVYTQLNTLKATLPSHCPEATFISDLLAPLQKLQEPAPTPKSPAALPPTDPA